MKVSFSGLSLSTWSPAMKKGVGQVMARSALVLGSSLACVATAQADIIDVNLSNDAVSAEYMVDMGQGFYVGGTGLHEEDAGQVASLNLLVSDELRSGDHEFTAGVGGKIVAVVTKFDGGDGGSVVLGGFVDYTIPTMKALSIMTDIYYGPSVTSFNHVEGLLQFSSKLQVELIERASIHIGYRKVRVKESFGSFNMDEGFNGGIKLEF